MADRLPVDANCRSCDAPIAWVKSASTGRNMPLDPDPVADGNILVEQRGNQLVAIVLAKAQQATLETRYVSHFVTCPQSDSWRQR